MRQVYRLTRLDLCWFPTKSFVAKFGSPQPVTQNHYLAMRVSEQGNEIYLMPPPVINWNYAAGPGIITNGFCSPGRKIKLVSLKGVNTAWRNGLTGTVQSWDDDSEQWVVALDSG